MKPGAGDIRYYEALAQLIPLMIVVLLVEYSTIDVHRGETGRLLPVIARMTALFGLAAAEWSVLQTLYDGRSRSDLRSIASAGVLAGFFMIVYLPTLMLVQSIETDDRSRVMSQGLNGVRVIVELAVVLFGTTAAMSAVDAQYGGGVEWMPWIAGGLAIAVGAGLLALSREKRSSRARALPTNRSSV